MAGTVEIDEVLAQRYQIAKLPPEKRGEDAKRWLKFLEERGYLMKRENDYITTRRFWNLAKKSMERVLKETSLIPQFCSFLSWFMGMGLSEELDPDHLTPRELAGVIHVFYVILEWMFTGPNPGKGKGKPKPSGADRDGGDKAGGGSAPPQPNAGPRPSFPASPGPGGERK